VIGQPYYLRIVQTKDGRLETGLLHAEDENSITLKVENEQLKVIQKKDIDGKVRVVEKSVMPEGLGETMTVQDFRDLIRYTMAHPFLTEVAVAGPFPEGAKGVPVGTGDPLTYKGVKWARPEVGVWGRIPLPASKEGGFVAVAAEVTAPEALKTRLQLGAGQALKVWLNGKLVYEGTPGRSGAPDQTDVEVQLQKGVNRLLVSAVCSAEEGALFARFLDPDRKLRHPEPR
jgi:hypothetical protein